MRKGNVVLNRSTLKWLIKKRFMQPNACDEILACQPKAGIGVFKSDYSAQILALKWCAPS